MADTAAFFAKKKKGKKKFKTFNANKVDVSSVSSTVHVDAPPIAGSTPGGINSSKEEKKKHTVDDDDEWDTIEQTNSKNNVVVTTNKTTELMDMVSLEERYMREEENLSDRMEKEATKKALAKAREGIEKEGQKLKEEEEKRKKEEEEKKAKAAAKAKAPSNTSGGKWIPPHMRANARPVAARKPSGSNTTTALNTSDEAAFPDLATAVKQPPTPEEKSSTTIQSNASKSGKWIPPHMRK